MGRGGLVGRVTGGVGKGGGRVTGGVGKGVGWRGTQKELEVEGTELYYQRTEILGSSLFFQSVHSNYTHIHNNHY